MKIIDHLRLHPARAVFVGIVSMAAADVILWAVDGAIGFILGAALLVAVAAAVERAERKDPVLTVQSLGGNGATFHVIGMPEAMLRPHGHNEDGECIV